MGEIGDQGAMVIKHIFAWTLDTNKQAVGVRPPQYAPPPAS